jgi:hypothetical protein
MVVPIFTGPEPSGWLVNFFIACACLGRTFHYRDLFWSIETLSEEKAGYRGGI